MNRPTRIAVAFCIVIVVGVIGAHVLFVPSARSVVPATPSVVAPVNEATSSEVAQAYLRHWVVFAHAMANLDSSRLSDVFGGAALAAITDQVRQAARAKTPGRIIIRTHRYRVFMLSDVMASVDDTYLDQSSWIDALTGRAFPPGPATWEHRTFTLTKEAATWKVTDIISFSSSR